MGKEKYLIVGVLVAGLVTILLSGCTGIALTCEDQSRQQLNTCNIDCGEGVMSDVCKTNCTMEHNARLDQCADRR